jgi:hypothetical protein
VTDVTSNDFRRIALGMRGAIEGAHMGHPDFRVEGRIFATLHADGKFGMVKVPPGEQQRLIHDHPETFAPEAGAWGRQGCTRVRLDAVDEDTLGEAMTLAWQSTAAKPSSRASRTPAKKRAPRRR